MGGRRGAESKERERGSRCGEELGKGLGGGGRGG